MNTFIQKLIPSPALRSALTVTLFLLAFLSLCSELLMPQAATDAGNGEKKSFLYIITNPQGPNSIAAYTRNRETGELVFLGTYMTGGLGNGNVIDSQSALVANAQGTILYAVNPGSNTISAMSVLPDGSLKQLGEPVDSGGIVPATLATNGKFLYVGNKGRSEKPNYTGFRITGTGELKRIKQNVVLNQGDGPSHLIFNKKGDLLIGIRLGGRILDSFRLSRNGHLRRSGIIENQIGPFSGAFNPINQEQLIVSDVRLPGAASYKVSKQGEMSLIGTYSNAPERASCWVAIHSNGVDAWFANTGSDSISLYKIGTDGSLTLSGVNKTVNAGRKPTEIVLSDDSRFLYELNTLPSNQSIHVLQVTDDPSNGNLNSVSTASIPAGSAPNGLVIINR